MYPTIQQEGHHSGYVGLIGRPNVGKSTLLNAYLKQSIAPVSPHPQTTRTRQLGILTMPEYQVIFVDTPGLHTPHHKLGEWINTHVEEVLRDCDVLLVIFDMSQPPHEDDRRVARAMEHLEQPPQILIALNKVDLLSTEMISIRISAFESMLPNVERIPISATRGDQLQALLEKLISLLPLGPLYYPEEDITDTTEREIAANLIRVTAMQLLRDEVPHSIAVSIDQFTERGDHGAYIAATLYVERESQKGIVIGKGGSMLKEIGTRARKEIERMSERKVFLELQVKVLKGWRNDIAALRRLGYDN